MILPDKELTTIELLKRMSDFELRLKEIELLAENLKKLNSNVELLTKSFENFVALYPVEYEEKNGNSVEDDVL